MDSSNTSSLSTTQLSHQDAKFELGIYVRMPQPLTEGDILSVPEFMTAARRWGERELKLALVRAVLSSEQQHKISTRAWASSRNRPSELSSYSSSSSSSSGQPSSSPPSPESPSSSAARPKMESDYALPGHMVNEFLLSPYAWDPLARRASGSKRAPSCGVAGWGTEVFAARLSVKLDTARWQMEQCSQGNGGVGLAVLPVRCIQAAKAVSGWHSHVLECSGLWFAVEETGNGVHVVML